MCKRYVFGRIRRTDRSPNDIHALLAGKNAGEIVGPASLLKQVANSRLEPAISSETLDYLGHEKHKREGRRPR